jgi:hypothetical protein
MLVLDSFAAGRAETHMVEVSTHAACPPPTTRRCESEGGIKGIEFIAQNV